MKSIIPVIFLCLFFLPSVVLAGVDLCFGLDHSKEKKTLNSLPKPPKGKFFTDPAFNSRVVRITDSENVRAVKRPLYSTIQSFNSDESFLILYHTRAKDKKDKGHHLYNGKTYEYIKKLRFSPSDIEDVFWDNADPNIVYLFGPRYPYNNLLKYNVITDKTEVLADFSEHCDRPDRVRLGGDVQMPSLDKGLFGFRCEKKAIFSYDAKNKKIIRKMLPNGQRFSNAPNPSPSGEYFFWNGAITDRSLNVLRKLDVANDREHSSLGLDSLGLDAYFATAFDRSPRTCNGARKGGVGSIVYHRFKDGYCRVLVGPETGYPYPPSGTHPSATSYNNPGWVLGSSIGNKKQLKKDRTLLFQEIYLANSDPKEPKVCRVAHHRSMGKHGSSGYFAEPHASLSPSGTRVIFASDWHNSGVVDTYVIELPSFKSSF